jgi:hypothetical protein
MKNNPASGVCVNFTIPMFECEWFIPESKTGYSSAKSNVSISMKTLGFEGLEDEVNIKFEAKILELIESDGRETTLKIRFTKEEEEPIEIMPKNMVSVLHENYNRIQNNKTYVETNTGSVRNLGNGTFLVSYQLKTNNITQNLNTLRENITDIPAGSLISHKIVSASVTEGWSHISFTRDSNTLYLYINGVQVANEDISGYGSIDNDQPVIIGSGGSGSSVTIDEIRFCNTSKPNEWFETIYKTYSSGFVSVGSRQNITQNGWQYKRIMTIDSDLVSHSQSNFPVLVRLNDYNFDYDLANTSGKDIRFNQSSVELPYEIEKWEYGGDSYIWVQLPSVSSGSDTTFELYYGNPSVHDAQDSIILWNDYNFVHHLEETSGIVYDSSGNANHGTYSGSSLSDSGIVDGGCGFDGDDIMDLGNKKSTCPGSGDFFISLWADIQNNDNTAIISKWLSSENKGYRLFVNNVNELVFMIDNNDDNATKSDLLKIIDDVESNYSSGERIIAHGRLLELREKLNPESSQSFVEEGYDTSDILILIDRLLDQLRPFVRIVARDPRGITVSSYGELTSSIDDVYGPIIYGQKAQPIQCGYNETVNLEAQADDRWYGNSIIEEVEYFISDIIPEGQSGNGEYMQPVDGNYDESLEGVEAIFSSNNLSSGLNYIWIHASDSEGNWGPYVMLQVDLIQDNNLYLDISGYDKGYYWSWKYWRYIYWAKVNIIAKDGDESPIQDVNIHGVWSGVIDWSGYGLTDENGTYEFTAYRTSIWYIPENEFTFIADSASKSGYTWDGETPVITIWVP